MESKRVAITVRPGDGLDSPIDPRFSLAPMLLIVDLGTGEVIAELDNDSQESSRFDETLYFDTLAETRVSAVISGRYRPKTCQILAEKGLEMWIAPEGLTAREALDMLIGCCL